MKHGVEIDQDTKGREETKRMMSEASQKFNCRLGKEKRRDSLHIIYLLNSRCTDNIPT